MSVIVAEVTAARAHLDEESGGFVLEAQLANGREVRFSAVLDGERLLEMQETLSYKKPTPRRRRAKKAEAADEG